MTISGERTEQLDIFFRVNGFTSDFLSFIDMELIRFFHGAIHLWKVPTQALFSNTCSVRRVWRYIQQQSFAVFNEFCKQKLINDFNYCL